MRQKKYSVKLSAWTIGAQQINQQINERKAESSKAFTPYDFSVMLPLPRQPVQQPKTQSAYCAHFVIKLYDYIHYEKYAVYVSDFKKQQRAN